MPDRWAGGHGNERRSMGSGSTHQGSNSSRDLCNRRETAYGVREARRLADRARRGDFVRTTFYVASSPRNHLEVHKLASYLKSRGWRWSPGHAWDKQRKITPQWVTADLRAALSADVFIVLLPDYPAPGALAQMTARWALHETVVGIKQDIEHHPLHDLPGIVWYGSIEEFAQATRVA